MTDTIDFSVLWSLARRTFFQYMKSPVAYVVAIFFYGFLGGIFGSNFFITNQGSIDAVGQLAPWVLWFVVPALTMSEARIAEGRDLRATRGRSHDRLGGRRAVGLAIRRARRATLC